MSRFRASTGGLDYADDEPQRWDRDKFERFSRRPPPPPGPGYGREDLEINIERERFPARGPPARVAERPPPRSRYEERDRYYEEERFGPPSRRRTDFLDEPTAAEIANRALAPYRRRPIVEREPSPPMRRPARPQFLRRQSSLDTFDRRAMPRYGDEYRIPADVPIPLPIRRPRSPPRSKYREEEFEEVRYKDGPGYDEYRDIRIRRERRGGARSRSRAATSVRSASSSSSSFEEVVAVPEPPKIGKKGKTRMPKRLAHKKAVAELGIPFEEEDDFLIIQRALAKENIDEIIEKSKIYKDEKTVYKYANGEEVTEEKKEVKEEEKVEEAPPPPPASVAPPPPPASVAGTHLPGETIIKTTTTILEGNPPPSAPGTVRGHSPARSVASHTTHRTSKSHHTHGGPEIVEERRYSEEIGGPLMLVDRGRQTDSDIRREIKALEAERRALKLEREADERRYQAALIRDGDFEIIERERREVEIVEPRRERERSVVRVEKDRKGRLALVRSAH